MAEALIVTGDGVVTGDLMGEFQAEMDGISAEDPIVGGGPESRD